MEIQQAEPTQQGSLERGVAGNFELSLGPWLAEAWGRVSGNKANIWLAMAFYIGLAFLLGLFFGFLDGSGPESTEMQPPTLISVIGDIVSAIILLPMAVGLGFIGTATALGYRPNPKSIFGWYDQTLKIVLTSVLMNLLIVLGLLLFVLPGIYLVVSYQIAVPLAVDKKLGPWQALEASRKTIGHCWFKVFAFDLVAILLILASMMLFGIPAIWTVPALVIAWGVLYRNLVGVEADTLQRVLAQDVKLEA